ncbi:MAG: PLP-dependent aminotransferase family protein [Chloroflexota bacterium]
MDTFHSIKPLNLYEQLANEISQQIEEGVLNPGDRLPSVRRMSAQKNLSVSTVLQAYALLEDQGKIEARPQSGYYTRKQDLPESACVEPHASAQLLDPETVRSDDIVWQMMQEASKTNLLQFGAALPAPDMMPSDRLNRIIARLARSGRIASESYGSPQGLHELRAQVARRAYLTGVSVSAEEVVITSGCMEAIHLALHAVTRPGDLVAVETPCYFGILLQLEALGLRALEIPTHPRDGISLEALEFAIENHPIRAVIVVSNFSNPLGSLIPDERKRVLVDLLARYEIPLIEDDIYGELAFNGRRPGVAKAYDRSESVMLCSSFSKDLSAALRVGWIIPGRYRDRLVKMKLSTSVSTALLPQAAIAEYLESGGYDHHLRKIRRAYAQKADYMSRAVLKYFPEGTRVSTPQGGYVLWVQLPAGIDALDLYRQALKLGITIAPGHIFSTTPRYSNFIRLNAAFMDFRGERAIEQLADMVRGL